MLKKKIVRETVTTWTKWKLGKATLGQDLMRLLEKLADDKPVASNIENDEPEVTIKKWEKSHVMGTQKKPGNQRTRRWCEHWSRRTRKTYSSEQCYEGRKYRLRRKLKFSD